MGRGSGFSSSAAATALSQREGHFIADGPNSAVFQVGGRSFLRPETKAEVELPALRVAGQRAYPAPLPEDRKELVAALWKYLVKDGKVLKSDEFRRLLREEDDISLSDGELRRELVEMEWQLMLPIISRSGSDGGFCIPRSRQEANGYADSLTGRADQMMQAAIGMAGKAGDWLKTRKSCCPYHANLTEALVHHLSDEAYTTSQDLLGKLDCEDFTTSDWSERGQGAQLTDSTLRDIVHHLRCHGVPIAGTSEGYRLETTFEGLKQATHSLKDRADETRHSADQLRAAAAWVWPDSDEERNIRQRYSKKLLEKSHSKRYLKAQASQQKQAQANKEKGRNKRQADKELNQDMAKLRMNGLEDSYQLLYWSYDNGSYKQLTTQQRGIVEEYRAARQYVSQGKLPRPKERATLNYAWFPQARPPKRRGDGGSVEVPF